MHHTRTRRYGKHLVFWFRSTILIRLAPLLLALAAWAVVVRACHLQLPLNSIGLVGQPLALLLAFRVNSAVARYNKARDQWSQLMVAARDLASLLAVHGKVGPAARAALCRHLAAFAWATKAVLRGEAEELERVVRPHS